MTEALAGLALGGVAAGLNQLVLRSLVRRMGRTDSRGAIVAIYGSFSLRFLVDASALYLAFRLFGVPHGLVGTAAGLLCVYGVFAVREYRRARGGPA